MAVNIKCIKEMYKHGPLKNLWSCSSREPLCLTVARKSDGCLHHLPRNQIDCEMHVVVTSKEISNLFIAQRGKKRVKTILVEGAPGIGKTTLCLFLLEDWVNEKAFQQFKLVLFFPLRQVKSCLVSYSLNEALIQLITEESVCTILSHYLRKCDGKNVLIIADGWDELSETDRHSGTFLYELLFGDFLNHLSVIVTSRPSSTESLSIPLEIVDKSIWILGFSKESINNYILSEFIDNSVKAHHLQEEMASNLTLQSMCTVPLNCAIVCHLYRSIGAPDTLQVTTMTELYKKCTLNTVLAMVNDDNQEHQLMLTFDTLPNDMQKPWWDLCEIAFSTLKNNLLLFSQEELIDNLLLVNEAVLSFNLLQNLGCGKKTDYFQFLHMTFQEFLAALFIANKMSAAEQIETYDLYRQSSRFGLVWRFFFGLCSSEALDAIKRKILSIEIPNLDLCHLAFEVKDEDICFQLIQKICKKPTLIAPTAYDCTAVIHVIARIQSCNDISLDVSNCIFDQKVLADILADNCENFQLKNLALPGNNLSDNDIANLFPKVSRQIEKLDLHNNEIGEDGVKFITNGLTKLRALQLSHNPLGASGIHALESAVVSGTLSHIQELKLQHSFTEDKNTNDDLLHTFLEVISGYCNELQLLDISENCIGKQGAIALAMNLSQKPLRLYANKTTLRNEETRAFFDTHEGVCSFESLEMKSNYINYKGVQCLVDKVSSGMLLKGEIHLDENPLGMESVLSIGQLLSNASCLISALSLINCQLNENIDHGVRVTAEHIQEQLFQMSHNNGLCRLELDCNNFTEDGVQILTGFMYLCPYLQFLSSSCCQLTSNDLKALLLKLSKKHTIICNELTTWCLEDCNIDDDGVHDLIKYVPSIFPNLTDIHLHGNPVSADMKSKLNEILRDMKIEESDRIPEVETDGNQQLQGHLALEKFTPTTSEMSIANIQKQQVLLLCPSACPLKEKMIGHLKLCELGTYQTDLVADETLIAILTKPKCQTVIVEGKIGIGKTSLVQQVLLSERLHNFQAIIYCQLDYEACKQVRTWKDLSVILEISESQLYDVQDMESDALFIFDEFDQFVEQNEWQATMFADILFRNVFKNSSVMVVSRPSGLLCLRESNHGHLKIDHHFQVKGFLNSVTLRFQDHWIVTMCEQHKIILNLCETPLLNELIHKFFEQGNSDDTVTDLLMFIVTEMLKREIGKKNGKIHSDLKLLSLTSEIQSVFDSVCKLAFESYVNDHKLTSSEEVNRFLSAFSLNNSFLLNGSESFGLIERVLIDYSDLNSCRIEFLHPLIRDFLAGFYLHLQPPLDQLELIHQHTSLLLCQSQYLMQFFFGLIWRKDSELDLNPSKLMFNTLIEFLASCLGQEGVKDSTHGLVLALCIAETKDRELWKKLVSKLGSDLNLRLSSDDISKHKWTIATMVSCSQVKEWNIHASNFSLCDVLEPYIGVRLNKLEVPSMEQSVIILSPKVSIEITSKRQRDAEKFTRSPDRTATFMNHFQCQAIREILQKAFAIYAEKMRLKGDSSNPAYVSFLSCECFQQNLENNLKFDPPLPSHFLQVNSAKTLRKLQEDHGPHLVSHGGKAIELVILLKPCLRKVTLTYKSKVHSIIMMSEALVQKDEGEGAVAQACKITSLADVESKKFVACTEEAPTASEMVRPPLPLPPLVEQNVKTTTILPQVTIAGASHIPASHSTTQEEPKHEQQQKLHESTRPQTGKICSTSSGSSSPRIMLHLQHTVSRQQQQMTTMTPSQQTQGTKLSIKPGAILFTSVPEQIPADHVHPLPDETHQMRCGGNGQIFKGTIGGVNVVYKKTNYRSKEYAIITKLKHKNIIKLLAFMYGPENPAHKRRHFCYHIMPQMSGDCARMLTDKQELTIKELHKKHGDNIRKMGIIRGNLKYLLKQILQGIHYLHSLRIAHRDVKGSNILLKFFCSCTNPLECGCDSKYQVQICDFDAAIELDENEQLPPSQVASSIFSSRSRPSYISVPVGTNGFRSPECSMLAISNVTDVFYPPITTRSDIWSLGVLTLRILIGATGPSSQREMAILLLHYYRQRYMHEGLHRRPEYLEVDRLVTDKLLSIPNLVREVGWLRGAVRFIECCVAVDPFARHSAEALLQHDFLY